MGEVVYVDFTRTKAVARTAKDELLDIFKGVLDPDDYAELLDAMADPVFYESCEEDIQDLVDSVLVV